MLQLFGVTNQNMQNNHASLRKISVRFSIHYTGNTIVIYLESENKFLNFTKNVKKLKIYKMKVVLKKYNVGNQREDICLC